jgi:hypothetical protein
VSKTAAENPATAERSTPKKLTMKSGVNLQEPRVGLRTVTTTIKTRDAALLTLTRGPALAPDTLALALLLRSMRNASRRSETTQTITAIKKTEKTAVVNRATTRRSQHRRRTRKSRFLQVTPLLLLPLLHALARSRPLIHLLVLDLAPLVLLHEVLRTLLPDLPPLLLNTVVAIRKTKIPRITRKRAEATERLVIIALAVTAETTTTTETTTRATATTILPNPMSVLLLRKIPL